MDYKSGMINVVSTVVKEMQDNVFFLKNLLKQEGQHIFNKTEIVGPVFQSKVLSIVQKTAG